MKKTAVYALILSAVSVAAGLIAGTALERAKVKKHFEAIRQAHPFSRETRPHQRKAAGAPKEIFQRLAKDLNLNPEQEQGVKDTLEKARQDILTVTKDSRERLLSVRKESNDRIMEILAPEQQERFKKIVADAGKNHSKIMERLGKRMGGLPGAPGEPAEELPPPPPQGEEPPEPPETF